MTYCKYYQPKIYSSGNDAIVFKTTALLKQLTGEWLDKTSKPETGTSSIWVIIAQGKHGQNFNCSQASKVISEYRSTCSDGHPLVLYRNL